MRLTQECQCSIWMGIRQQRSCHGWCGIGIKNMVSRQEGLRVDLLDIVEDVVDGDGLMARWRLVNLNCWDIGQRDCHGGC